MENPLEILRSAMSAIAADPVPRQAIPHLHNRARRHPSARREDVAATSAANDIAASARALKELRKEGTTLARLNREFLYLADREPKSTPGIATLFQLQTSAKLIQRGVKSMPVHVEVGQQDLVFSIELGRDKPSSVQVYDGDTEVFLDRDIWRSPSVALGRGIVLKLSLPPVGGGFYSVTSAEVRAGVLRVVVPRHPLPEATDEKAIGEVIVGKEIFKRGDQAEAARDQRRYTNVSFAADDRPDAIPAGLCLGAGRRYRLRVDIGSPSPDSIVKNATPFDETILPASDGGHWLDVVVNSSDFGVAEARHRLFLPRSGSSWVCSCPPGREHTCTPEARHRFLMVSVETPGEPGTARLRLLIYFERNLLESHVVTAEIADEEMPGRGTLSMVDYTLTDGMRDIERLPPQDMNILTEKREDGSHTIVLNGDTARPISLTLTEGQMTAAVEATRTSLHAVHIEKIGKEGAFSKVHYRNRYGPNNAKSLEAFKEDFARQALLGWKLWVALLGNDRDKQETVGDALRSRSTIQVSRTARSNFVFPWGLVYDLPLESDPAPKTFCPIFDEADKWSNVPAPDRCPHEDAHELNTLCPYGFWGLKHVTEQPPASLPGAGTPLSIALGNEPSLVIARSTSDLDMTLVEEHLGRIGQRLSKFAVKTCDTRDALRTALSATAELVYFYCHGRTTTDPYTRQSVPALQIGDRDMVEPADLTAWSVSLWPKGHWKNVSPLIFINGCHTTEITPESLVSFVDAFVGIHAAGVIGTEVAIYQEVAAEIAELFYSGLMHGASVGAALRDMRWQLLTKGNLMGLAYTPYCSGSLQLITAAGK